MDIKIKRKLNILIACEESQTSCIEFRNLGCNAFSCDLQDCSGGFPEWHIKEDARKIALLPIWDLIIAHPPCTYLSNVSARYMFPKGKLDIDRYNKMLRAREFFYFFYELPGCVCIENPKPLNICNLPECSQVIQPYYFDEPYSKRTHLWLKNLPPLMYTCEQYNYKSFTLLHGNGKTRSKSFKGISKAMAAQWTYFLLNK